MEGAVCPLWNLRRMEGVKGWSRRRRLGDGSGRFERRGRYRFWRK